MNASRLGPVLAILTCVVFLWALRWESLLPGRRPANESSANSQLVTAGFKTLDLACSTGSCSLDLALEKRKVCHLGDLDAIKADLRTGSGKDTILLTVEPLLAEDRSLFPVVAHPIFPTELASEIKFEIQIPKPSRTLQIGIFLCRDDSGKGSCLGKDYLNIGLLFGEGVRRAFDHRNAGPDRIYFFAYALFDRDGRLGLFEETDLAPRNDLSLTEKVRLAIGSSPRAPGRIPKELEYAKGVIRVLQSELPRIVSGGLRLELPEQDPRCPQDPRLVPYLKRPVLKR